MPLAGEKASATPSLHSTIVAIADRVGSVIHKQVAEQVRTSRRAHLLSDFYVRGSASKSLFIGAIYLVGLSPSSVLSCFLQLEKARNPPAIKKSVGAALQNRYAHDSDFCLLMVFETLLFIDRFVYKPFVRVPPYSVCKKTPKNLITVN